MLNNVDVGLETNGIDTMNMITRRVLIFFFYSKRSLLIFFTNYNHSKEGNWRAISVYLQLFLCKFVSVSIYMFSI